jgi:hypothetical protein
MTMSYALVLETEDSGAVSAYVPGLPIYAAAETQAKAERAIRAVLTAYLHTHPASRPGGTRSCGALLRHRQDDGRHRRRRGPGRCTTKRREGARLAKERPQRRASTQGSYDVAGPHAHLLRSAS